MANYIDKATFLDRLARRMQVDDSTAKVWLDTVTSTLYDTFKDGLGVSLPGFGGFYLERRKEGCAFKFNPGQKLRALFGWSSTYKGPF
ncbi:MAG TPA: HU family DNA-binding protein [Candidatus Lokiarchaeia archaeon]|nr:HU family DNA-binding protein [Candidatus Lokiarchaeia archaeon]